MAVSTSPESFIASSNAFTTLITVRELASSLHDPDWVVLDCRHDLSDSNAGRAAYSEGHLPSAQFAHLDFDLSGNKVNEIGAFCGRHPLPEADLFIAKLRAWGINNTTQVVAYDAHGGMFAARLWWLLRWVGHTSVAVLDGGFQAWIASAQPITTGTPTMRRGSFSRQASVTQLASSKDVQANCETKQKILVDARAPDRFRGENETLDPVGGHIPGAINRFFKDNLAADGRFKTQEQLRAEWSEFVIDPHNSIMQCGSGVTACHNLLALEVAGLPGAALYAGSWSEWCIDPRRPVATGSA